MTDRQRLIAILIGVAGAIASFVALAGFLSKIMRNALVLPDAPTTQAYYKTVGAAYSDGFVSGFALCFFLTLLAVAIGTWFDARRKEAASSAAGARLPEPSPR